MRPTVAVVDTSEEVADLLCQVVEEEEGWRAVRAYTTDFKRGREDLALFLAEHRPAAIIWDIALPYEENWRFFQSVLGDAAGGYRVVLTTTNKRALEALVGPTPAHELIGKPYDLDDIVASLRRALGEPPA